MKNNAFSKIKNIIIQMKCTNDFSYYIYTWTDIRAELTNIIKIMCTLFAVRIDIDTVIYA